MALGSAVAIPFIAAGAQPPKPPASFVQCAGCHATVKGRVSPVGPNLFGVVGRRSGTVKSSLSSPAMAKAKIVWSEDRIDAYLAAPQTVVPGTAMATMPVKDPETRKELVAYLATLK